MLEFCQGSILSNTLFLLYSKDLLDNGICNIAIYADDTTLYSKYDQASDLTQQLGLASELEYDLVQDISDRHRKRLVNFNARRCFKCWFQCFLTGLITIVLLMWKWMSLFLRKNQLLRYWGFLSFSSKLDWGSCIVSLAKTVFKKIRTLNHSLKFLSHEVILYLYISTIQPFMEYCCHVWAGAPGWYLEMFDKL